MDSFPERYERNRPIISEAEQTLLHNCTAAVVGLGGLGGCIAEQLARIGFGKLILIDGDNIEASNLNRQAFADEASIGLPKTEAALRRLRTVNSLTECRAHSVMLGENNAAQLLKGADIVLDALDNIPSRRILRKSCRELKLPMVHGAIGSWYGQVSFFTPDDDTFDYLYPADADVRYNDGNPVFTPALVASVQTAQAVKWRLGKGSLLIGRILYINLLDDRFDIININSTQVNRSI